MKSLWKLLGLTVFTMIGINTAHATAPSNDKFANAQTIASHGELSGTVAGSNVDATLEAGEGTEGSWQGNNTIWYRYTAPKRGVLTINTFGSNFDSYLAVYTGSSLSTAKYVDGSGDASNSDDGQVRLYVQPQQVLSIQVGGDSGDSGNSKLGWSLSVAPANDDYKAAVTISDLSGSIIGSNVAASLEAGEGTEGSWQGNNTIWYRYTVARRGWLTLNTFGSEFDSYLAVYTGSSLSTAKYVDGSGDSANKDDGQIRLYVQPQQVLSIQVGGDSGDSGNSKLSWSLSVAPQNDDYKAALTLSGSAGSILGSNVSASLEDDEGAKGSWQGNNTVWYRWTAPDNGTVTFDTFKSNFDSYLAIYTGGSLAVAKYVDGSGDAANVDDGKVTFSAVKGTVYSIQVGGDSGDSGQVQLNWSGPGTPTYSLSGWVHATNSDNLEQGVLEATVELSTGAKFKTSYDGYYFFSGLAANKYTLTATATGKNVNPDGFKNPVTVSNTNVLGLNFKATAGSTNPTPTPTPSSFSVSGRVVSYAPDNSGVVQEKALTGVMVSGLYGRVVSVSTNTTGDFTFPNLATGEYTIVAHSLGAQFLPVATHVVIGKSNVTGLKFTTLALGGTVKAAGKGVSGVKVSIAGKTFVTTNSTGLWYFPGVQPGTYALTFEKSGLKFPSGTTLTISSSQKYASINVSAVASDPPADSMISSPSPSSDSL